MEEQQWLTHFIQNGSEKAFASIVQRHLPLVYGVALRQLHDRHLAEDVAQATFVLLARKAASIRDARALPNWLFKAARYAAANALRLHQTRRRHEQEAAAMRSETDPSERPEATWQQILPALEQAMETLPDADRQAILLRFYEDRSLREVGQSLGVSEDAARKRLDRAVGKLREALVPAGVAMGASVDLAALLAANAFTQIPATLASAIAATACQAAAHATHATLAAAIVKGAASIMGTAIAKIIVIGTAASIVVAGAAIIVGQVNASGGSPAASTSMSVPAHSAQPVAQASATVRPGEPMPVEDAVSMIMIGRTTREELLKLLGEPNRYAWNNQTFTPESLPQQYVMQYNALTFMMGNGAVEEIRFEGPSPYKFRDKIGVGSPLAQVLEVLGQPRQTVEGQAIGFQEGVLYRKCRSSGAFDGYYQRSDQGIRLFLVNDRVVAVYLTRMAEGNDRAAAGSAITSEMIDQLQLGKSTRADVIKAIGEPLEYTWNGKIFTADALPEVYLMAYPGGDQVAIRRDQVAEIRFHHEGPYRFKGIKVGSSFAEVTKALGQPKSTATGRPNRFEDGVLYKDIDGQPGQGYYQRSDLGVRMFLLNDAVAALYLIPPTR